MIDVKALSKTYSTNNGEVSALSDISFSISKGEFVSVIGPSGCGKSTLLRIIGDLIEPSSGNVTINGHSTKEAREGGLFSFVFQNPVLLPWRTILENVHLPLETVHQATRDPLELLNMVGLADFGSKYPNELSGGMQQRAALARSLTFDPSVLLMDEPFGALDEFTRNELNDQLIKIWAEIKVSVLFVTHSISEAVYLSDRVIVLTKRPAQIGEIVEIPFKRPRTRNIKETNEFQEKVKWLRKKLE